MSRKRKPSDLYELEFSNQLPLTISPEKLETNYWRPSEEEITDGVIVINKQGIKPCTPKPKTNTFLVVKNAFNNPFGKEGGTRKRRKRKKKKNRRKTRNKKGGYRRIIIEYNKILLFDIIEWSDKMNELYKKEINHFNSLKGTQLIMRKAKNMGRQEKPTSVDDIKQLFSRLIARMMALIIKKKNRNNNKIQEINNDYNADKERLDKKSILEIENNDLDQTSVELQRILLDGKWGGKKRRRRRSTKKKRKKRRRSTKKKKRRR